MSTKTTYAALTDVTPTRATVLALGSRDECREAIEAHGDDTCRILPVEGTTSVGERVPCSADTVYGHR